MTETQLSQLPIESVEHLLSLPSTSQISNYLAQNYPDTPSSLLTSCIIFLKKNSILDSEKVFIFTNILLNVHLEAIRLGLGVVNVFENLKKNLLKYTVHSPPFSVELFSLNDFKVISSWICDIYLKHYKLFLYRDGRKEIATVAAIPPVELSVGNLTQGLIIRPLGESTPSESWVKPPTKEVKVEETTISSPSTVESNIIDSNSQQEEDKKLENETLPKEYESISEREEPPDIKNAYIKKQLLEIQKLLLQYSSDQLVNVESKIQNIENAVQQQMEEIAASNSKGKKK